MGIIGTILLIIFIIASILLILIVLMQDDQGEGIGGIFGGGGSSNFGSRSGNILTKFTSFLGLIFLVTAFGLIWINTTSRNDNLLNTARNQFNAETPSKEWWVLPEEKESTEKIETEIKTE